MTKVINYFKDNPIVIMLVIVSLVVGFTTNNFFSWGTLSNLISNTAIRFLIALGVSGCLITKGTDLSAGRQVGLAACLAGILVQRADYSGRLYPGLPQFNIFLALAVVVLIGACLQVVSPEFICNFNRLHFDDYKYNMFYYSFFKGGYLTGFSFQTAITAYYCSIFVAINACYYFTFGSTLNTIKKVLLICISMLALIVIFFTSKRSFILYSIIIVLFLCYFYYKKHIIKIISYTLIICGSIYYLLINTEAGQRMIDRSQGESLTTNRSDLVYRMLSFFNNKPLTGNGLSSTLLLIPDFTNGHNIYVQILCETGLIGFIILIPFFIKSLFLTFKQLKLSTTNNSKYIYSSCLCIQMLFLMWGFTGNPLYDVYPLFVYMISVAIVWSMQEYTLKEKEKP